MPQTSENIIDQLGVWVASEVKRKCVNIYMVIYNSKGEWASQKFRVPAGGPGLL